MTRATQFIVACVVVLIPTAGQLQAEMIAITSYDITDAARSGMGGWQHTYSGSIVDTGNYSASGLSFTRANYSGGSGTLNDGLEGTGASDTELFGLKSDVSPTFTLHLDGFFTISDIALLVVDSANSIPGHIAGFDVTILGITESFVTSEQPTLRDAFVDLTGSSLDGLVTNQIILSNFSHDNLGSFTQVFAIGEIEVQGSAASVVPLPSSLALLAMGASVTGVGGVFRRRSKKSSKTEAV
ncbi:hypothetical protein [Blastopirellula marina]|uniref:PEP-CTERM protein-sorting domain-containing protein n=1 Tax=Blastopirellula marina TaxID=124 RepID=A0A2S8F7M0_9BACT|nr:hypothetical protein [Blastopirellula marina]PQO28130.1 hypothetical protein C5Y98_24805 [Blastopirellula marina]PTL41670.1 hypothetical protein C5Y97_24820 [Blastopirellula marina]